MDEVQEGAVTPVTFETDLLDLLVVSGSAPKKKGAAARKRAPAKKAPARRAPARKAAKKTAAKGRKTAKKAKKKGKGGSDK